MRKVMIAVVALTALVCLPGCPRRKIDGPRIWWDDQARERLPDQYQLPEDPRVGTERDPKMQGLERYGLESL